VAFPGINTFHLTFSIWPFKYLLSAAARVLFILNVHFGTVFSFSDKKDVHLMGWHFPIHPVKVK
jgi:hypothetical protein